MKPNLIIKFLILFSCFANPGFADKIDSLFQLLEPAQTSNDQDNMYEIYSELGKLYGSKEHEDYQKSAEYFQLALDIAENNNDLIKTAACLYGIGLSHQRRNNYPEAMGYYSSIIELEGHSDTELKKAGAYTQISSIHQALGNYEDAFEYQMQALHLNDLANDSLGIANSHYNLGTIFYYQTRYKQALNHYLQAYEICKALQDDRFIYSCLAALGSVYEKMEKQKESLEYNEESLKLAEKLKYKTGIAYALGNVAMNYVVQQNFEKAEKYLKKSISLKLEVGDKWGAIGSNIDLAKLYVKAEQPAKALPVLEKTLEVALEMNAKTRQLDIYKNMATAYDLLNDHITAYSFTKKYIALKDSLLNEKTVEEMGQSKRRYEIQKHQHEIVMLKKENELLGKNKMIAKLQKYIFTIAALFFVSFLWWYKSKLKYQSKMNKLLEEKNEILNIKNEEIHVKNEQLKNSNEDLQRFAYVASHDLKEPIRMISSYSTLLKKRYHEQFDNSGKEFLHFILDAVSRMETLLDDLLNFSRAGNQPPPTESIPVKDVMEIIQSNLKQLFENQNATLIIRHENLPSIKAHRTQLMQLFQNLVSNGVKFKGERDPIVIVDCEVKEDNYLFSVKDNGIGISKENQDKVFEMFRRLHTREEYEGTGIGLAICKRIVKVWGGDIWIESVMGEGSTFFFTFPRSVEVALNPDEAVLVERA